jgi:predicted nuclease of restriction endonuclease-like (RecB) superfamily
MLMNSVEYLKIIDDIRVKIKAAQHKAVLAANSELVTLYWNIGTVINKHAVWGNKFIENIARDIKLDFPSTTGYSVRNLKYMAKFAKLFPDPEIVQATLAQITWYHNMALMDKVKDTEMYLWYAAQTVEN